MILMTKQMRSSLLASCNSNYSLDVMEGVGCNMSPGRRGVVFTRVLSF